MVKGNPKSSATSTTRKKHLKKHAPAEDTQSKEKRPKKGERGKKEPRVKMYIPPVKPTPVQPDPLETTGLAHTLPADLLVVLRNISKKAQVTKTRALEELQSAWVNQCLSEGSGSLLAHTLVEMLPVWLHHASALFVNPSRRVRLLTASLHSTLLQIPPVRDQIVAFLRERTSESQLENILGTWCLATHDIDSLVAATASKAWKETILTNPLEGLSSTSNIIFSDELRSSLSSFVQRAALDPSGVYAYLNPVPPPPPPPALNKKGGKPSTLSHPRKDDGDVTPRSKLDEQEESETDRRARLRIGALGAARWILSTSTGLSDDLQAFYANPALWTILHSGETCPWVDVENFGFAQPNVRKAGWNLVQTLLKLQKEHLGPLVPLIGTAILRSAWVENDSIVQGTMWQPLLIFLKHFPQSWTLDAGRKKDSGDEDEGMDSDADSDGEHNGPISKNNGSSQAYQEFLQFLESGCSSSPAQGYPTVVIIVSTIPSTVLASSTTGLSSPLSDFFNHFWGAIDSRALSSLHRVATSAAFLSSLLECVVFLVKRMKSDNFRQAQASTLEGSSTSTESASQVLVRTQFSRVWEELTSGKLKVEDRAAARLLAQTLESLLAVDQRLLDAAWDVLAASVLAPVTRETHAHLVSAMLKVFYDRFKKDDTMLKERGRSLMMEVLGDAIERCELFLTGTEQQMTGSFVLLVTVLDQFREGLFFDQGFSNRLDTLLAQHAFHILSISPSLLLSYLIHRKNEAKALIVWHSLLSNIASRSENGYVPDQKSIGSLLEAAQRGSLPIYLQPQAGELDSLVGSVLGQALVGPMGSDEVVLTRQILTSSGYFLSHSALNAFLHIVVATFTSNVAYLVNGEDVPSPAVFDVTISLIQAVFGDLVNESELAKSLLPNIFLFSYLLYVSLDPESDISPAQLVGKTLWQEWLKVTSEERKIEVTDLIKLRLKDITEDPKVHPTPEDILHMLLRSPPGLNIDLLQDIFPSSAQLDATLDTFSGDAINPSIEILDPLIPPATSSKAKGQIQPPIATDPRGFSGYARIVNALALAFMEDRQLAKRNIWALRHFFALSTYAQDLQNVPSSSSRSPIFDDRVTPGALSHIVTRVKHVSVYLFNSASDQDDGKWRAVVLDRLLNAESTKKNPREGLTLLQTFLFDVVIYAKNGDAVRDTRVLKMVLEPLLMDGLETAEADTWVQLSRKYEKLAPQTAMTIISLITASGAEPPKLDRYRNELAAGLLGVKPSKANTEGLLTLRRLVASAPDPQGAVIFLPSPRAVNVVKACQAWVLAEDDDDELDEDVESAMLPIFMHLAPILQNIPGGHWAFVFDVLEAAFERLTPAEGNEDEADEVSEGRSLVALARALKLVAVLEELAKRNKALMAEWSDRRMGVLTVIRDLGILGNDSGELMSVPRSACRELVLSIVQHLPSSLIDQDTLPKMCHFIEDPAPSIQKMAYQLLKVAAKKRTEHFVIEAGVDTEAAVQATLPSELLEILQREMYFGYDAEAADDAQGDQGQNLFGYLLGWMLVFDLFQDASFKVKSSYIEQLRNQNIVLNHFIPCFLGILRLDQGGLLKAFKLDVWAVDQFYIELYEPGSPHTIPVLTAHVYYRALLTIPSLIHGWVLDCKDRQLTNTVTTYTSTYFSPVLIQAELDHVRTHATNDGLADDSMSIKVANAVNEVAAAYSVDEHQLEIKLRIPSDWPLHKIEVRDVKRVGVDENRWRAWVLGVQQTIWAHNGRIVDGLGLFKKNVTLHFEGQVECAICYSIISVMDGTLPKKPCKTCKNRFHAGCLYKWFNTSHSSSCPLCRSDII